jgi:hypothetical protein
MTIRGGIFAEEGGVLFERTAAVVEVVDLYLYVRGVAERNEFLLNGIPGKAISYT